MDANDEKNKEVEWGDETYRLVRESSVVKAFGGKSVKRVLRRDL